MDAQTEKRRSADRRAAVLKWLDRRQSSSGPGQDRRRSEYKARVTDRMATNGCYEDIPAVEGLGMTIDTPN